MLDFRKRSGMWRTDILFDDRNTEAAKICEINARIPYNGFFVTGLHEESTRLLGGGKLGFEVPNEYEVTLSSPPLAYRSHQTDINIYRLQRKQSEDALTRQNASTIFARCGPG